MEAKLTRFGALLPRSPAMRLAFSVTSAAARSERGRVAALPRVDLGVMDRAAVGGNKVTRQVAGRNLTRACSGPATRPARSLDLSRKSGHLKKPVEG